MYHGRSQKNTGCCDTVVRSVWSTEKRYVWIQFFGGIGRERSQKCEMTDRLVILKLLYFSAASGEIWFIRLAFSCF